MKPEKSRKLFLAPKPHTPEYAAMLQTRHSWHFALVASPIPSSESYGGGFRLALRGLGFSSLLIFLGGRGGGGGGWGGGGAEVREGCIRL